MLANQFGEQTPIMQKQRLVREIKSEIIYHKQHDLFQLLQGQSEEVQQALRTEWKMFLEEIQDIWENMTEQDERLKEYEDIYQAPFEELLLPLLNDYDKVINQIWQNRYVRMRLNLLEIGTAEGKVPAAVDLNKWKKMPKVKTQVPSTVAQVEHAEEWDPAYAGRAVDLPFGSGFMAWWRGDRPLFFNMHAALIEKRGVIFADTRAWWAGYRGRFFGNKTSRAGPTRASTRRGAQQPQRRSAGRPVPIKMQKDRIEPASHENKPNQGVGERQKPGVKGKDKGKEKVNPGTTTRGPRFKT